MEKLADQIKAIKEGKNYYDKGFNNNSWGITFDWFNNFRKSLEIPENKEKWSNVDTFVVIPIDAKNEIGLFITLEQYSTCQDLSSSKYGMVLFLNSKDDTNIAQRQVEEFQNKYPNINIAFHFHNFTELEASSIDIAKIRNVGYNFVSLLGRYYKKNSNNIVLIGVDADAIQVSKDYLSFHRELCLLKDNNDENLYTCVTSKWLWNLTGNIFYDFFLLNNQINNQKNIPDINGVPDKYPSEGMTSFPLNHHELLLGLQTDANKVSENYKLIEFAKTTKKLKKYSQETETITNNRRAVDFINKSTGDDILNLNRMWNKKGSWDQTGDEARKNNKGSPPQAAGYSLLKQNCLF